MTWPPSLPPATRSDTTPQLGNHADDHNLTAAALDALVSDRFAAVTSATETAISSTPRELSELTHTITPTGGTTYLFDVVIPWRYGFGEYSTVNGRLHVDGQIVLSMLNTGLHEDNQRGALVGRVTWTAPNALIVQVKLDLYRSGGSQTFQTDGVSSWTAVPIVNLA